jgi:hypothetical protein
MYPDWKMKRSEFEHDFFSQGGEDEDVNLCELVTEWKHGNDEEKKEYEKTLNPALAKVTKNFGCGWKSAWDGCAYMEDHMGRLTHGDENC